MRKEIAEVRSILKEIKETKNKVPPKEKNILDWTAGELSAYVIKETKGMSITKRFKFAQELDKRIKDERLKGGLKK
jgi:hypothetical protein